jgi:hypothetical protein
MLREPRQVEKVEAIASPRKSPSKSRFQFVKLEERIAPRHHHKGGGHQKHGGVA